jgi:hypothetical protein
LQRTAGAGRRSIVSNATSVIGVTAAFGAWQRNSIGSYCAGFASYDELVVAVWERGYVRRLHGQTLECRQTSFQAAFVSGTRSSGPPSAGPPVPVLTALLPAEALDLRALKMALLSACRQPEALVSCERRTTGGAPRMEDAVTIAALNAGVLASLAVPQVRR